MYANENPFEKLSAKCRPSYLGINALKFSVRSLNFGKIFTK